MNIQEYITGKKEIQEKLLIYLDENSDENENYKALMKCIEDQIILDDENEFRLLLHLIKTVSIYHFRESGFLNKIKKILIQFKDAYKKYFSNIDLFNFFFDSKPILLIFIENGILQVDEYLALNIVEKTSIFTQCFFFTEIKDFINEQKLKSIEEMINENDSNIDFDEKRHLCENESYLSSLIRNDSVEDFIIHINKKNISLSSKLKNSIFETNQFLIDNQPTLIEYAAFYGSIQIFLFLFRNNVELDPLLWLYSIHGRNPEIIQFLEENNVKPEDKTYKKCLIRSIACHHNNLVEYFINNYIDNDMDSVIEYSLLYYNFNLIPDILPLSYHNYSCSCDYYFITKQLINEIGINCNNFITAVGGITEIVSSILYSAIANDNFNIVEFLINNEKILKNLHCYDFELSNCEQKYNAYFKAISNNNYKMLQLLFKIKKPDINFKKVTKLYAKNANYIEVREVSPLIKAICFKNFDIINTFISDSTFDINFGSRSSFFSSKKINWYTNNHVFYEKPLIYEAIERGFTDIVKLFLENPFIQINKKSVDTLNNIEETALSVAIKNKNIQLIEILLSNSKINVNKKSKVKIDTYEYNETPLYQAIREQNFEIVKILLNDQRIKINKKSKKTLFTESKKLKETLEETVLHLAIRIKNKEIVQLLISHQIDVNKMYIKEIYDDKLKSVKEKCNALNMAILSGDIEIIKLLISCKNIDINSKSTNYISDMKFEWNPLSLTIYQDQSEIIEMILSQNDININTEILISKPFVYSKRQSALYLALEKGNEMIVEKLLTKPQIDVNYTSSYITSENGEIEDKTLLHLAFEKGNDHIIKSLISFPNLNLNSMSYYRYSDKDFIKEYQETTFTCSVKHVNAEILKILLSDTRLDIHLHSFNLNIDQNKIINRAEDLFKTAIQRNNTEIFRILLKYARDHGFYIMTIEELSEISNDERMKDTLLDFYNRKISK